MLALRNLLLLFCLVCCSLACEETSSGGTTPPASTPPVSTTTTTPATDTPAPTTPETGEQPQPSENTGERIATDTPTSHSCEIKDPYFKKNVFWAKDAQQLITIVATAETKDKDLGDSHRVLKIYNTTDCSLILSETLPINRSSDFPYYLAPRTYENENQIVAIQGFTTLYFYDVANKKLSAALEPEFLSERETVDAQSGMIRGLMVWRKHLLGHSVDYGPFCFDLKNKNKPKAEKAVAEYAIPKTAEYNYLFLVEDANDRYMALLPTTDIDAGGNLFEVQPMFRQGITTERTLPKNIRNNRYVVFNDKTDPGQTKRIAIDMYGKRLVILPPGLETKKTSEVLKWIKENQ